MMLPDVTAQGPARSRLAVVLVRAPAAAGSARRNAASGDSYSYVPFGVIWGARILGTCAMAEGHHRGRLRLLAGAMTFAGVAAVSAAPVQATLYGAYDVRGSIEVRYLSLGGPPGFLGLPLTHESVTPDRVGRYNHFQGGSVYWSPVTNGAWEVHGAIRARWEQTGWEKGPLGYPLSNEEVAPDGVGRFGHFQNGKIYWTPTTGAQEIYGSILGLWASQGYERSRLGYPTSGEYAVPGGRRNNFQGGYISWTPLGGAVVTYSQPPAPSGNIVVRGSGTDVVSVSKPVGPMLAVIRTVGSTNTNFIVYSRLGGDQGALLANEIGSTELVAPLDFKEFGSSAPQTTGFEVRSDTSWEIVLIPLSAAGNFGKGATIGEARSTVWHYTGSAGTAHLTNRNAASNFIVVAYNADTSYSGLLVNEIGAFDGRVPIKADQYLEIISDGAWTITAS